MDGEAFIGIAVIIGFVALFGAILFFSIRAERRLQAALRAMAEERGWEYQTSRTRGMGRRSATSGFTVTPNGAAADWRLEVKRRSSSGSSGRKGAIRTSNPGRAEFRAAEPTFRGGLAMFTTGALGGAIGIGQGNMASSLMGMFDNKIGKTVLSHFMGADMGEHVGQLQSFPAPEGSGLTVMATADPSMFFDMEAIGEALRCWKPAKGSPGNPQLVVGEAGIRLFLSKQITDAETVASFIDLGLELREKAMREA
ncbi:MAG: hypothetical protein JJT95_05725 [Pararhodobacter sp.]|nr:hypothetical protein [Pararhodobacter sp.]